MRNQDALDVMLRFNGEQFLNRWTKSRRMTLRNQLEHFSGLNTSRKEQGNNLIDGDIFNERLKTLLNTPKF